MEIANDFVLHDLAVLDDALDLGNQEGANTHCITSLSIPNNRNRIGRRVSLSLRMSESFR
jgi:hypothetical protein